MGLVAVAGSGNGKAEQQFLEEGKPCTVPPEVVDFVQLCEDAFGRQELVNICLIVTSYRGADKAIIHRCLVAKGVLTELDKVYNPESHRAR